MRPADGPAGARRAAALVGIACCAETTSTTTSEDAAKVDIKFSFRDAFSNALITVHAQVKSGRSYLKRRDLSKLKLGIDKQTIAALNNGGTPGLLMWVPPKPQTDVFWYYTDPRAPLPSTIWVPLSNTLRPSIRFDLTRAHAYGAWQPKASQQTVAALSDSDQAKVEYQKLQRQAFFHPLVGKLNVSRYAWRHVTRRSKSAKEREDALLVVKHLAKFLSARPDRYRCVDKQIEINGRQATETRNILCWYRKALRIDNTDRTLVLRIREVIRFPTDWQNLPLALDDIQQEAVLASWWYK